VPSANDIQYGGNHYKTPYEHWDFVLNCGLGYLEGNATRYLARWQKAGKSKTDLEKARHYVAKILENCEAHFPRSRRNAAWVRGELARFCAINKIEGNSLAATVAVTIWETRNDLASAISLIDGILADEFDTDVARPVPATDSNKHAERTS
jgi:Protein of unknwon function (DUF3310)